MGSISEDKKSIQIVTALVLQLIQCCTALSSSKSAPSQIDDAINNYESAVSCSKSFIGKFIKKCASKIHENDYRPILENFVEDLLHVLNLPEWPAAETLLQVPTRFLDN